MALLVQKFGGTSVGSVERIQAVAERIGRCRRTGDDVVMVVSAMGHTTDELTRLAAAITKVHRNGRWTCCWPAVSRCPSPCWRWP